MRHLLYIEVRENPRQLDEDPRTVTITKLLSDGDKIETTSSLCDWETIEILTDNIAYSYGAAKEGVVEIGEGGECTTWGLPPNHPHILESAKACDMDPDIFMDTLHNSPEEIGECIKSQS